MVYLYSMTTDGLHWKFVCRFDLISSQTVRFTYFKIKCFFTFSQFKGEDMAGEGKIRMAEELRRVEMNLIFTAKGTKLNINSKYCLRLVFIPCCLKRCANEPWTTNRAYQLLCAEKKVLQCLRRQSFPIVKYALVRLCLISLSRYLSKLRLSNFLSRISTNNLVHSQHLKLSITYWNKQAVFFKD